MNEKPKNKLRWRLLRWGLIGMTGLVTLAAVLVTEENWRGKRAWENYKREAAARGERLDIAAFVPPSVPDEQNFFCAPIVAEAWEHLQSLAAGNDSYRDYRMHFDIYRGYVEHSPNTFHAKDWQSYYRKFSETAEGKTNGFPVPPTPGEPAADVLFSLSIFDSALEELRQAAARPAARMPINYADGFDNGRIIYPWLANAKCCGQFLKLRIQAELENNQSGKALDDAKLFLRVTDASCSQNFLITHLVRIAMLAILEDTVDESIREHRWSDAQLAELESALAQEDVLANFAAAMEGEKLAAISAFEKQRLTREMKNVDDSSGKTVIITNSLRFMPSAYFYRNQLAFAEMHRQYIVPLVDFTNRIVSPAALRIAEAEAAKNHLKGFLHQFQANMVFSAIAGSVKKFAHVQTQLNLTRTACALERFRLTHGTYPESLAALAPQFIAAVPNDIINGQPLRYRRTDDGNFLLYSVGWNETDDDGSPGTLTDVNNGDWVWPCPVH